MPCFNKLLGHSGFRRTAAALPRAARHALMPLLAPSASYKTQALGRSISTTATSVSCLTTPPAVQALVAPASTCRFSKATFTSSAASATSDVPPGQKGPSQKDSGQKDPGPKDASLDVPLTNFFTRLVVETPALAYYLLLGIGIFGMGFLYNNQGKSEEKLEKRMDLLEMKMEMKLEASRIELSSKLDNVVLLLAGVKVMKEEIASLVTPTSVAKVE